MRRMIFAAGRGRGDPAGRIPRYWRRDLKEWAKRRFDFLTAYLLAENPTTGGRRFRYEPAPRIRFTEIHYHPEREEDLEFLELQNLEDREIDLSLWRIPAIGFEFPEGSAAPAGGLVVVARDPKLLASSKRIPARVPLHGPYPGRLSDGGEELRLIDSGLHRGKACSPETIDVVRYDDQPPWPTEADGAFDLADAMRILMGLFAGEPLDCPRAADVDDGGVLDLADPVGLLVYLFASGSAPRPPFGACGTDGTADELECGRFDRCSP